MTTREDRELAKALLSMLREHAADRSTGSVRPRRGCREPSMRQRLSETAREIRSELPAWMLKMRRQMAEWEARRG